MTRTPRLFFNNTALILSSTKRKLIITKTVSGTDSKLGEKVTDKISLLWYIYHLSHSIYFFYVCWEHLFESLPTPSAVVSIIVTVLEFLVVRMKRYFYSKWKALHYQWSSFPSSILRKRTESTFENFSAPISSTRAPVFPASSSSRTQAGGNP